MPGAGLRDVLWEQSVWRMQVNVGGWGFSQNKNITAGFRTEQYDNLHFRRLFFGETIAERVEAGRPASR